jgi:hypothetical protein
VDKELLKKRRAADNTRQVPIDDLGSVTVRALSRTEVKRATVKNDEDQTEANFISAAMVDPVMTPEDVAEWLDGAPAGDSVAVADAIAELSGMSEGAQKSGVPGVRKQRRR